MDPDLFLDEESEEEEESQLDQLDLSVPEGIGVEDPVRMYLKEIGKIPLLTTDQEIELAKRMELGDQLAKKRPCRGKSPSCSKHCQKVRGTRHAVSGSDPGRQSGTHQSCGEV